jgi:hypothetical protein
MNILVDTSVWSLALRHNNLNKSSIAVVEELTELINEHRAFLAAPIIQELLSGVKNTSQFIKLENSLKPFELVDIHLEDYTQAARLYNQCRANGIQGSHTDYLLCAIAIRNHLPIFTVDKDFTHYAKYIKLQLHEIRH